jgi:hypothetical protein
MHNKEGRYTSGKREFAQWKKEKIMLAKKVLRCFLGRGKGEGKKMHHKIKSNAAAAGLSE